MHTNFRMKPNFRIRFDFSMRPNFRIRFDFSIKPNLEKRLNSTLGSEMKRSLCPSCKTHRNQIEVLLRKQKCL